MSKPPPFPAVTVTASSSAVESRQNLRSIRRESAPFKGSGGVPFL